MSLALDCPHCGEKARNPIGRCYMCGKPYADRTEEELAAGIACGGDAAPKPKKSKSKAKK